MKPVKSPAYQFLLSSCIFFFKAMITIITGILFMSEPAFAQTDGTSGITVTTWIYLSVLFLSIVFLAYVFSVLRNAMMVLRQNGQTVDMTFPIFREMARNGKTVTVLILLIVAVGIYLAMNYSV